MSHTPGLLIAFGSGTDLQVGTRPGRHPVARGDIMIWPRRGRLKQTVTLSHASLLFSRDTSGSRTRAPRTTQKTPPSVKNSSQASFFLSSPLLFITPLGVNSLAEWINRTRASLWGCQSETEVN